MSSRVVYVDEDGVKYVSVPLPTPEWPERNIFLLRGPAWGVQIEHRYVSTWGYEPAFPTHKRYPGDTLHHAPYTDKWTKRTQRQQDSIKRKAIRR